MHSWQRASIIAVASFSAGLGGCGCASDSPAAVAPVPAASTAAPSAGEGPAPAPTSGAPLSAVTLTLADATGSHALTVRDGDQLDLTAFRDFSLAIYFRGGDADALDKAIDVDFAVPDAGWDDLSRYTIACWDYRPLGGANVCFVSSQALRLDHFPAGDYRISLRYADGGSRALAFTVK